MESFRDRRHCALGAIGVDDLRLAVALYMRTAYATTEPPETIKRRLDWFESPLIEDILAHSPFERTPVRDDRPEGRALRLGNCYYPHMKLVITPWDWRRGKLLSVDSHDQLRISADDPEEKAALELLQARNARIKDEIESAWDEAGLPTHANFLREYLEERRPSR